MRSIIIDPRVWHPLPRRAPPLQGLGSRWDIGVAHIRVGISLGSVGVYASPFYQHLQFEGKKLGDAIVAEADPELQLEIASCRSLAGGSRQLTWSSRSPIFASGMLGRVLYGAHVAVKASAKAALSRFS